MDTFPIIHCRDLERSLRFYRDELGFTEKFRWPENGPLEFLYVERDDSGLGLARPDGW
jgi:catechol 2,3-dioxygenase-like lactoylglutathione lyase family enzyme